MTVSPLRFAIGAAVVAAIYALGVFAVRPVPNALLDLVGGDTAFHRDGGMRLLWRPPPGREGTAFDASAGSKVDIRRDGDHFVVEVAGIAEADVAKTAKIITSGGFELHDEIEGDELHTFAQRAGVSDDPQADVRLEPDTWEPDDGSSAHRTFVITGPTVASLDHAITAARAAGWSEPTATELVTESTTTTKGESRVRLHLLSTESLIDHDDLERAEASLDRETGRPIATLDFTRSGAERFADITSQYNGHKLAIVVGGEVISDPVINGRIGGGRAVITMGNGLTMADAEHLVAAVNSSSLPSGGTTISASYVAPTAASALALGRTIAAAIAALLAAGLGLLAVMLARPSWLPVDAKSPGRAPVLRVAVMGVAAIVVYVGLHTTLPIVGGDLTGLTSDPSIARASLFAVDVQPVIAAAILVELAVLAIPAWRPWRTRGPFERRRIAWFVAILAIVLASVVGFAIAGRLQSSNPFGNYALPAGDLARPGLLVQLEGALSVVGGTLTLVSLAALVATFGLGNGYAAILTSAWLIHIVDILRFRKVGGAQLALFGATILAIAAITTVVLRWRIGPTARPCGRADGRAQVPAIARDGAMPLRLPTSGIASAYPVGGLFVIATVIAALGLWSSTTAKLFDALSELSWRAVPIVVIALGGGVAWSFAFARPGHVATLAARASLLPPSRIDWWRATSVSCVWLLAITALGIMTPHWLTPPLIYEGLTTVIATATALDLVADWRGRRGAMVAVWSLHDAQHVDLARSVLATGGVRSHVSATHVRSLFALFGPWAPMTVYVARDDAKRATELLLALFDERRPPPNVEQAFA